MCDIILEQTKGEGLMFMLQCDEYQESYDDEQNEIEWQFVYRYEEYMMMQQDDQWEWDFE